MRIHRLLEDKWLLAILLGGLLLYAAVTEFTVGTSQPIECYAKNFIHLVTRRGANDAATDPSCNNPSGASDFYLYYMAASVFAHGGNAYAMTPNDLDALAKQMHNPFYAGGVYVYPLLPAFIILPLLLLPFKTAAGIWIFLSGLAALTGALLLATDLQERWQRRLFLIATLLYIPILNGMYAGNISALTLLPVAAGVHFLRRRKDIAAGAWLMIGLWIKLFTAPLFALLVWRSRWRALWSAIATAAVILLVVLVTFGPQLTLDQTQMVSSITSNNYGGFPAEPTNENLNGMLTRWFVGPARSVSLRTEMEPYGAPLVSAPQLVRPLYFILAGLFGLATLALLTLGRQRYKPIHVQAAFVLVAMLLLTPMTEYHHMVIGVIAFAVLIERTKDWHRPDASLLLLGATYIAINLHAIMWKLQISQPLLLDFATWGLVALWFLLARELIRLPAEIPGTFVPEPLENAGQQQVYQPNSQVGEPS